MPTATHTLPAILSFHNGTFRDMPAGELPQYVRTALTIDDGQERGAAMMQARCNCTESYGISIEHLEVWRLPGGQGWLILHDDGDALDAAIYVSTAAEYMALQAAWIAPMAQKIMKDDEHFFWRKEAERQIEAEEPIAA